MVELFVIFYRAVGLKILCFQKNIQIIEVKLSVSSQKFDLIHKKPSNELGFFPDQSVTYRKS